MSSRMKKNKLECHPHFKSLRKKFNAEQAWVKISADDILKYFSYFSQKTGIDFMQTSLHEMLKPIFWEK